MRKLLAIMLLLLMMTCVSFAEDAPAADLAGEPGEELQMEPQEEPQTEALAESQVELQAEPKIDLASVDMVLPDGKTYTETGSPIRPKVKLINNNVEPAVELVENEDYTLEYSENNVKPGTATVTAKAVEGSAYTGSQTVEFTIEAKKPDPVSLSKATMTLSDTKYYKTGSEIKPTTTLKYNGKKLTKGTHYTLSYKNNIKVGTATVTATAKEGSGFKGTKSRTFTIIPKKPSSPAITKIKSNRPYVNVAWKKVTCTGYELQVSKNSNFKNAWRYKVTKNKKAVLHLKSGKKYNFRVRAYNTENKKTTYGNWWKTSCTVATTGPIGDMRYSKDGEYLKDKTIEIDGDDYYFNSNGIKSGCDKKMWTKVRNTKSKTKYLISVDTTKNRTCIYEGKKGNWKLIKYWKCTTGKKSTPTIKGKFEVCGKMHSFGEHKGYSAWYASRIAYDYHFHSILYHAYSKTHVKRGKLGKNLSHGCVRLALKNAKWLYKNCKKGTRIVIY